MATRIYTRSGDGGETGLADGRRVPKSDPLIDCIGTLDELNCMLGLALAQAGPASNMPDELFHWLQSRLFDMGAVLAGCPDLAPGAADVRRLEDEIDRLDSGLPPLKQFILPGGTPAGAGLHAARAVCRRAERLLTQVPADQCQALLPWLNRLSDLLFVLARHVNHQAGIVETTWTAGGDGTADRG